jgi:uncharacterized protein
MDADSRQDAQLDETLEETFPASDAPSNTVETGIGGIRSAEPGDRVTDERVTNDRGTDDRVTDDRVNSRFELAIGDEIAFLQYERQPDALVLVHTEVPVALRGRRIGGALVEAALAAARSAGLRVIVLCPFARAYLRKHPHPPAG